MSNLISLHTQSSAECETFHISFDSRKIVKEKDMESAEKMCIFYEENGYVVISNVFTGEECDNTVTAMWNLLEESNPKFNHNDCTTWDQFKATGKYGLSTRGPSFHPTLVKNRQNPLLASILTKLLKLTDSSPFECSTAPSDDLMVSHDRYTVYRATVFPDEAGVTNGKDFTTGRRNVHLDLNPWWWLEASQDVVVGADSLQYKDPQDFIKENNLVVSSMGNHCQIVMNFLDNRDEDGGTLVVPRFHHDLVTWTEAHRLSRRPLPWVEFTPSVEEELLSRARRVTMRAGSVLIWNQTLAHGTAPNDSNHCRMAQYMKAFSRSAVFSQRPLPRSATVSQKAVWKPKNKKSNVLRVEDVLITEENAVSVALTECDLSTTAVTSSEIIDGDCGMNPRLIRRAIALRQLLEDHSSLEVVTPLGRHMFGLDVLDPLEK